MSFLEDIINPPAVQGTPEDHYKYSNTVFDFMKSLLFISNPSIITNANFATLGSNGTTPVTQADGDDAEFSSTWKVFGAATATYAITPTAYASNSLVQSFSLYYQHVVISGYAGTGMYFYQRQVNTIRWYQKQDFSFALMIKNNQAKTVKVRIDVHTFYNPSSSDVTGNSVDLEPGLNDISTTLRTLSLSGKTVGATPYTEFRLSFGDLGDGTADLEIYQIKGEFGTLSTMLSQ